MSALTNYDKNFVASSNKHWWYDTDEVDAELTQLRADLATLRDEEAKWLPQWQGLANDLAAVTQERDELKADAVRFNIHLEQKDKALKANTEACAELEKERDELRAEVDRLVGEWQDKQDQSNRSSVCAEVRRERL